VISSLIHELPNADELIGKAKSLCHAKSILHVNVPNSESFHIKLAGAMGLISKSDELSERAIKYQRSRTFNLNQLKVTLEVAGFEVLESGDYFIKPFTHAQMAATMQAGIINEAVINGLANLSSQLSGWGAEIYVNCAPK
jgi:hypothetical protein